MGFFARFIPSDYLEDSRRDLSVAQRAMAQFILGRVQWWGYRPHVGMAAVANALAESNLNPLAQAMEHTGHASVGLFQLHTAPSGAGRGYSPAQLVHPKTNLDVLFERERKWLDSKVEPSQNAIAATQAFCIYVERPAGVVIEDGVPRAKPEGLTKAAHRADLCLQLFGDRAQANPDDLPAPAVNLRPFLYAGAFAAATGAAVFGAQASGLVDLR